MRIPALVIVTLILTTAGAAAQPFASASASLAGYTTATITPQGTCDAVTAVIDWVEKGQAPDSLLASTVTNGQVVRTRPLCPYQQVARYTGQGSIDEAANVRCVAPPR